MKPAALVSCAALVLCCAAPAQRPPTLGSDPFRVVPTMKIRPAVADGVPLRVVDAGGAPHAGIDVVVLQSRAMSTDRAREIVNDPALGRMGIDFSARMLAVGAALGERYVTDEEGRTQVAVDGSARVFATLRRAIASAVVTERSKDRLVEIVLAPPPCFEVLVTDWRGRPARGLPLVVVDADDRFVFRSVDAVIETGRDGRAWIPRPPDGAAKDVVAMIASRSTRRIRLDPGVPQTEMQLPPCGQLRVYAAGEGLGAGRRVTGGSLSLPGAGFGSGGPIRIEAEEVGEDFVTFRWVGVTEPLEVSLQVGGRSTGDDLRVTGPDLPGEMKVVRMDGIAAPLARTVRLLGPDREPLSATNVLWAMSQPGQERLSTRRTDLLGRLAFTVEPRDQRDDAVVVVAYRDPETGEGGAVRWALPSLRDAADGDLGDVVLEREPVLAAGRVVDESRAPVVGLRVRSAADYMIPGDGGRSSSSSGVGDRYAYHTAITDADGRFELRELNPARATVQLLVDTGPVRRIIGELEHAPGVTDLELVLASAARLEGAFAALPDQPRFDAEVRLVAADGTAHEIWRREDRRRFEADGLEPGTYTMEVLLPRREDPLYRVEGIELVGGETCRDTRLAEIDWSAFVRPIRVTITDADGARLPGVNVRQRVRHANRWRDFGTEDLGDGVHALWATPGDASIRILHPAYRSTQIDDLTSDREVALAPRPKVLLSVKNLPELPTWMGLSYRFEARRGAEAGPEIQMVLAMLGMERNTVTGAPQIVRPDLEGPARLVLSLTIDWEVQRRIQQVGVRASASLPRDVEVRGGAEVQGIDFELTEGEIASLRDLAASIQEVLDRER